MVEFFEWLERVILTDQVLLIMFCVAFGYLMLEFIGWWRDGNDD